MVRLPDIAAGKWAYPLLTLLFLAADWLAISPVHGRALFYYKISRGERPALQRCLNTSAAVTPRAALAVFRDAAPAFEHFSLPVPRRVCVRNDRGQSAKAAV